MKDQPESDMISKNKICVLTSSHNPFDTRIFKKECRSLVDAGYDVTLFAPADQGEAFVEGVKVVGFGRLRNRADRLKNLCRIGRMLIKEKADLYHTHEPELLLLLPLLRLFRPRAKFVYDVHENYSDAILSAEKHWISDSLKPMIAWFFDLFEKGFAKRTDLVVAAGPDIEARFRGCTVVSVRNYAPMHIINTAYAKKESRVSEKETKEIVYTGSLTRTRGILEIVKAIELIESRFEVRFIVTGKFHDPLFQKEVENQKAYGRVRFLGFLPNFEDMVSRIICADIAMICFHPDPNLDNAVERSNKLFEYMGMGLPLIVSNLPEWAAMVENYRCGLTVDPLDPRDIAAKITFFLDHPREAEAMGRNGREAVLKYFSWENEGNKLVAVYEKILSGRYAN